jgi:hypothetical protein
VRPVPDDPDFTCIRERIRHGLVGQGPDARSRHMSMRLVRESGPAPCGYQGLGRYESRLHILPMTLYSGPRT